MGKKKKPSLHSGKSVRTLIDDHIGKILRNSTSVATSSLADPDATDFLSDMDEPVVPPCVVVDHPGLPPSPPGHDRTSISHAPPVFAEIPQQPVADSSPTVSVTLGVEDTSSSEHTPSPKTSTDKDKPWASLFHNNCSPSEGMKLTFTDCESSTCSIAVTDFCSTSEAWGPTLIGYVAGRFPGRESSP